MFVVSAATTKIELVILVISAFVRSKVKRSENAPVPVARAVAAGEPVVLKVVVPVSSLPLQKVVVVA